MVGLVFCKMWEFLDHHFRSPKLSATCGWMALGQTFPSRHCCFLLPVTFPSIHYIHFATGCKVRGSNPGGVEILRTSPDRPWGPPSLLYNGYRFFPGGKAAGPDDHPPSSSPEVKERVGISLYSPSGPLWPILG